MSSELEPVNPLTMFTPGSPAAGIVEWEMARRYAYAFAEGVSVTETCPAIYRGRPGDGAVAILRGASLGFDPVNSLDLIYVVRGKAAMYARTLAALVLREGHEIWTEEFTETSVTVCGKRQGSEHVEKSTWTIERATRAGYTANAKYQTNPQEMLYAKALAEVCRHIAPDALLGTAYTAEDLELEDDATQPPATVTVKRGRRKKQQDSLPVELGELPVEPVEPVEGEGGEGAADEQ